jgi:predicted carbohydrate-binding protein with CBM5 and CBM33 domain
MSAVTRTAALAATGLLTTLAALAPALPAAAHGATTQPISRTAACASKGSQTGSAACKAARKANGGEIGNFDNLRVANVNGRDREVVPDGKLCSGGLSDFAGLDLARDDWPATKAKAGDTLAVRYATTIPHQGTFRIYLTEPGYDPAKKLRWDDLATKPLLVDKDPPLREGAYRMSVKLPEKRTGRQVLYVIWQTSSTPDTYYSCSDLDLGTPPPPATKAAAPVVKKKAAPVTKKAVAVPTTEPAATTPAATDPPAPQRLASVQQPTGNHGYLLLGVLLVLAIFGVPLTILMVRRGRRRPGSGPRIEIR